MKPIEIVTLKLLIALARLALEHDKGYASRSTWNAVHEAIKAGEAVLP
jgi:hypothetical protein